MKYLFYFFLTCVLSVYSCKESTPISSESHFIPLKGEVSGVLFENELQFIQDFNIYKYRNFYNGGGVGIGDVNNDGNVDIYFTANMQPNKLYLNNGDLTFEDVTMSAGVEGNKSWSTGVSMVDINADHWLDIYVCNSGNIDGDNKQNELFINNGDGTYSEQAEEYGLADKGFSTHAAFFDYDRDGDLDAYLLNNSFQAIGSFNLKKNQRPIRNTEGGDKLFRNDGGHFVDVSESAGIYGSVIGFGLGVTVGDINLDGWLDIFVSNDFFERDYIYMNNGDGTFTENLEDQMKSITGASMGADMADINNDGYPEIFVTEMLPEPNDRLKTKTTFENWDRYQYNLDNGYYHQFTRNMMHLNNGDGTFSEIGRMLGVEATDWSWGALISDFDNDGQKDLFIANGIYKDLTDQDYINYISTTEMAKSVISEDGVDFQKLTDVIPSNRVSNYIYRNQGGLQFEDVTEEWGLDLPTHSNGSAYADLDNDGDLDLVINNVNDRASLFINQTNVLYPKRRFLKLQLNGGDQNTQAVGARIVAHLGASKISIEQMPVKGFQSSVDPRPNLGYGSNPIDSLEIYWPTGDRSIVRDFPNNDVLTVNEENASDLLSEDKAAHKPIFESTEISSINYAHQENHFIDFDRDKLIYHMLSVEGPALCKGDFNGDQREDFWVGGAKDQAGAIFLQRSDAQFERKVSKTIEKDKLSEDVDCACFDADGDGDLDIYVASGGNEFPNSSSALIDRLYINDGRANFSKSNQILPSFQFENTSTVQAADIDGDRDVDLFIGVRAKPFLIGVPTDGYILENDGRGNYTDVTTIRAPDLKKIGMITDATWTDIDGDTDLDLIIVGEWMPVTVFRNDEGSFANITDELGLDHTNGWWNTIEAADLDGDGDADLVIGNHGLNSRFKATKEKPIRLFVNDFDKNGSAEPVITTYFGEESYPLALKHDLVMQMPSLKKKYVAYESYKDQRVEDIFSEEQIASAIKSKANMMESSILINDGAGRFDIRILPIEAQMSPVYAIEIEDYDADGQLDMVIGGNFYNAKPEVGRYDASYGVYLKGIGQGKFEYLPNKSTGLNLDGQIRSMTTFEIASKSLLMVARNDTTLMTFSY